ncbi:hypothetical protein [Rhodococcus tukisamuensis]|uniref:DUF11 domain-containing protein n=1 Tax=Rhodococcus tukisamuensis TaxID=168276 RepID=A0A1G6YI41_9NOCA|nr:hypothetical protein [Rhodococcus tukisamuensis]SDD90020.1 hypothetical protein SAMN05444580_107191 [Rhodococcus tukisamuensis]
MVRPSLRRLTAAVVTAALLAGGLAAGAGTSGATGSAILLGEATGSADLTAGSSGLTAGSTDLVAATGSSSNNPDLPRTATRTVENVSATREVIGDNTGLPGDTVTYRTTVAATAAPDRLVTRIADLPSHVQVYVPGSAKVTYTAADGTRTTEAVTPVRTTAANGLDSLAVSGPGWPISAESGATLVYEITYRWTDDNVVNLTMFPTTRLDTGVALDVTGLGTVGWTAMGALAGCEQYCVWRLFDAFEFIGQRSGS